MIDGQMWSAIKNIKDTNGYTYEIASMRDRLRMEVRNQQ